MARILAIDPGTSHSAWLLLETATRLPVEFGIETNQRLLGMLRQQPCWQNWDEPPLLACEWVESYGMAVGKEVFETCWWAGRFCEAWACQGGPMKRVTRKQVKLHLCQSMRASDTNIRGAIIDLYGNTRREAVGIKASPGPLYGIKTHLWAALGVALTAAAL